MARNEPRPPALSELRLEPLEDRCRSCGQKSWVAYHSPRTVATLSGLVRLRLVVRRCVNRDCELYHEPHRPEAGRGFRAAPPRVRARRRGTRRAPAVRRAPIRPRDPNPTLVGAAGWSSPSAPSPTCWTATTSCSRSCFPPPTTGGSRRCWPCKSRRNGLRRVAARCGPRGVVGDPRRASAARSCSPRAF